MSLKYKYYYWLQCDGCYKVSSEEWETWPTVQEAIEYAKGIAWEVKTDGHFCPDCYEQS